MTEVPISYRDLISADQLPNQWKFLHDRGLRHEIVKAFIRIVRLVE